MIIRNGIDLSSSESIKNEATKLRKELVCSIIEDNTSCIAKDITEIKDNLERFRNKYIRNNSDEIINSFYCGYIMAITNIKEELISKTNTYDLEHVNSYPLLLKVMEAIDKKGNLSASEIIKELNMTSLSTLNNLCNRVKDFDFIRTEKIGRKRYYFLTVKGKDVLKRNHSKDSRGISEKDIIVLLDKLNDSLQRCETNELNVISNTFIDNSSKENKYLISGRIRKTLNTNRKQAMLSMYKEKNKRIINQSEIYSTKNTFVLKGEIY